MTTRRKILVSVLVLLLALPVVGAIVVANLDWNRFKPTVNEKVSAALGRPFAINGDLSVRWERPAGEVGWHGWIPWPRVSADDIRIANASWARGADLATLERASFTLSPLPLLARRVVIREIQLTHPTVELERQADGRANWVFTLPESGESSAWRVDVNAIGFDQGHVNYRDAMLKTELEVLVDPLGKPVPFAEIAGGELAESAGGKALDYVFGWQVRGSYEALPVHGSGKAGGMLTLRDAAHPFPLEVDLKVGTTEVSVVGTLTDPLALGALDLRLKLSGVSMANLFDLTGVTLPDTPPYSTDGHLQARLRGVEHPEFHYREFHGRVGDSDLHGDLRFILQSPRPKLIGQFTSRQLRVADLGPLIGVQSGAGTTPKTMQAEGEIDPVQPADKVLPVQTFRTDRWRDMDADISLQAEHIEHSDKLPLSQLDIRVLLEAGHLTLDPFRVGVAGGRLEGTLKLDGDKNPMHGQGKLAIRRLQLKQLFPDVQAMQRALGEVNGDITLAGNGNSVAALLGSASGDLRMVINKGLISRALMELAGLNVGSYIVSKLFDDDEVKINCGVADLEMDAGLMKTRLFVLDTENAVVSIDGSINFRNETLDLNISPESKGFRLFSLRSPLYVKGTFKRPDVGVHVLPLIERGVGALALGVLLTPAASLLALVAPSSSQEEDCSQLFQRLKTPSEAGSEKK